MASIIGLTVGNDYGSSALEIAGCIRSYRATNTDAEITTALHEYGVMPSCIALGFEIANGPYTTQSEDTDEVDLEFDDLDGFCAPGNYYED